MIQPLWRTVWRFLKKLGLKLPHDPTIPLLVIYPEKIIIEKDTGTPIFIAAVFTIARTWKQPRCPLTDEWKKKLRWIYAMKYSAIQMNAFESVLMSCQGIPGGASGKELTCQCRIHKRYLLDPWVGKIPWRRKGPLTPVFFPGRSYGLWSLVDYRQ